MKRFLPFLALAVLVMVSAIPASAQAVSRQATISPVEHAGPIPDRAAILETQAAQRLDTDSLGLGNVEHDTWYYAELPGDGDDEDRVGQVVYTVRVTNTSSLENARVRRIFTPLNPSDRNVFQNGTLNTGIFGSVQLDEDGFVTIPDSSDHRGTVSIPLEELPVDFEPLDPEWEGLFTLSIDFDDAEVEAPVASGEDFWITYGVSGYDESTEPRPRVEFLIDDGCEFPDDMCFFDEEYFPARTRIYVVPPSAPEPNWYRWASYNIQFTGVILTDEELEVATEGLAVAQAFAINSAYPNPTAVGSYIDFRLEQAADVDIALYNVLGQRVRTIASGLMAAGEHSRYVSASDLAAGIYIVRMEAEGRTLSKRLTVAR